MQKLTRLAGLLFTLVISLSGCSRPLSSGEAFGIGVLPMEDDYRPASKTQDKANQSPRVVGPPQVVYRIDKDRYIGMENYTNCGNGKLYYHNDAKNIKTQLWFLSGGLFNYKGKMAWLADNDKMLAVPLVPDGYCSERGCTSNLRSSADGGKTFTNISFSQNTFSPVNSSADYLIIVTNDAVYLRQKSGDKYGVTSKFITDENNVFYNSGQRQFNIDTNNELAKIGIPREALNDNHPSNFDYQLLMKKYHYTYGDVSDISQKIDYITRKLRERPRKPVPDATSSPAGDSSFHCDVSLVPNQTVK